MSMCQNERSCVACCGTLNVQLSESELQQLLSDRTELCPGSGNANHQNLVSFREDRERIEESISRYDESVYVCPFVGWIAPGRAGCLIHPTRTGRADSQNASFYGATICQSYDCHAKQEEEQQISGWQAFAESMSENNAFRYTRIVGDTIFLRLLEAMGDVSALIEKSPGPIRQLLEMRITEPCGPTSFEIPVQSAPKIADMVSHLFRAERHDIVDRLIAEAIDATEESQTMKS